MLRTTGYKRCKMVRLTFAFCLLIASLSSLEDPDNIYSKDIELPSESEPLATVAGCVNVVSGSFYQVECDLVSNTIDPVRIIRSYDSQSKVEPFLGIGFSLQFPVFASTYQKNARHSYALISEREGGYYTFQGDYSGKGSTKTRTFQVDPRLLKKGYTNAGYSVVGANGNVVNRSAELNDESWSVVLENGSKRFYSHKYHLNSQNKKRLKFPTYDVFLLTKEIKPNGNSLEFDYQYENGLPVLASIKTFNRDHSHLLNQIDIHKSQNKWVITSSCKSHSMYRNKTYHGENRIKTLLDYVSTSQQGHTEYGFIRPKGSDTPLIASVTKLGGYQQILEYDSKKRVIALNHTVGANNQLIRTHQFSYGDHYTSVSDCLNRRTDYFYDKNNRIIEIKYIDKNLQTSKTVRTDHFEWSRQEGREGWLKSKTVKNSTGILHKKTYEYDDRGNVIKETIYGNITGEKPEVFEKENEVDCYSISYEYSHDEFNLQTKVIKPEGLSLAYTYHPHTNLKASEFEIYDGKIQKRIFYQYDNNGQISQIDEDNGSLPIFDNYTDADYHLITRIISNQSDTPAFGKPHIIEKSYLQIGEWTTHILTTTLFEYDERGNSVKTTTYDCDNRVLTQTSKTFDLSNRVIEEVDANGNSTRFEYDFNNNIILKEELSSGTVTRYTYNSVNKLTKEEIKYSEDDIRTSHYSYGPLGNIVQKIDELGLVTDYKYDFFDHEIEKANPASTFKCSYNVLGHKISETDANGNCTHYIQNIYGHPVKIIYPDGSQTTYHYFTNGKLKEEKLPNGTSISYSYNPKGYLIKKEIYDSDHQLIKSEAKEYKGDLLCFVRDSSGSYIHTIYDHAGRIIAEDTNGRLTHYKRDGLGRIRESREGNRITQYSYDGKGNLISKELIGHSKEFFLYDAKSNKIQHTYEITPGNFLSKHWKYNGDSSLSSETNEEGFSTTYLYKTTPSLTITKTDPTLKTFVETFDNQRRLVKKEVFKQAKLITRSTYQYDANSNLTNIEEDVFFNGCLERTFSVLKTYDSRNRLNKLIEGDKRTEYFYDYSGNLVKKIQPDGVELWMTYDAMSRLTNKKASDGSIDYDYIYDHHDNLVETKDNINGTNQIKTYDCHDRLTSETFNNHKMSFHYDLFDRLTEIILPDQSSIQYEYDLYNLLSIRRFQNHISYEIFIKKQDCLGRPLQIQNSISSTFYSYSPTGNCLSITNPLLSWEYGPYDPNGNLLQSIELYNGQTKINYFKYDDLDQLISEEGRFSHHYSFDSIGNCKVLDFAPQTINSSNQLIKSGDTQFQYDLNGRVVSDNQKNYTYDALGRLKTISNGINICYDAENRPLSINGKTLLYLKNKEIGAIENSSVTELKIVHPTPSNETTFACEMNQEPYFVNQDKSYNITCLTSFAGQLVEKYDYSSFKEENPQSSFCPWRYKNRRHIENLTLFKHRLYSPEMRRWLSPDPLDYLESNNLYRFAKNNPQYYHDPDGRFAFVIPLAVVSFNMGAAITSVALPTVYTALAATTVAAAYYGCKAIDAKYHTNLSSGFNGAALYTMNSIDVLQETDVDQSEKSDPKKYDINESNQETIPIKGKYKLETNEDGQTSLKGVYTPDRKLPQDENGHHPDSNTPHTQLGTRNGECGKYTQAREWGYDGELIQDIDFADHGYPNSHPVPHKHIWRPNPSGGSKIRDNKAQPFNIFKFI